MSRRRRLSRTAVEQAVRETKTRDSIEKIHDTEKIGEGRHQVDVVLVDTFADPRAESPAVNSLIVALEAEGWTVAHRHGRFRSRLTVFEPVEDTPEVPDAPAV